MASRAPELDHLRQIKAAVAGALTRHGLERGDASKSKVLLRITREENVRRVVQAYWTPFQAEIPGECLALHLEVAEPRVFWSECYLSPTFRNWVFCFAERPDGEIQLTHYADFASPEKAIERFFDLSSWYVLTASGTTWDDVVYQTGEDLEWEMRHTRVAGQTSNDAVQEALKKSTILWLRWRDGDREETMPVWFLNDKGTIYVLNGERQQTIPNVRRLQRCDVILRWKGKNTRIAEIPASVRILDKNDQWLEIAEKIAEKRLNIPGAPEETARRWQEECDILEVTLLS